MAYAAIGTDGTRPVVWGLGATERAALDEALRWTDAGGDLEVDLTAVEVSEERAGGIRRGDVDASDLVGSGS